jgi:plastocyanin
MARTTGLGYAILVAALLAGCGGSRSMGPDGGGGGGSGSGGDGGGGGLPPAAVTITVGNILFRSDRNGSVNSAIDTVATGSVVRWRWVNTGQEPHNVQSLGEPVFASGPIEAANGSHYDVTFTTPGTYRYNCAVHGDEMTGVVVVKAP